MLEQSSILSDIINCENNQKVYLNSTCNICTSCFFIIFELDLQVEPFMFMVKMRFHLSLNWTRFEFIFFNLNQLWINIPLFIEMQ